MKNKTWIKLLLVAVIMLSVVVALASCNPVEEDPVDEGYAIPDDLTVSIGVYFLNTDAANSKGLVTKDILQSLTQKTITMSTVNDFGTTKEVTYVVYSIDDIIAKLELTLPTITSVRIVASDGYVDNFDITSFAKSYISIGYEEDGEFSADSKGPRFISDADSTESKSVTKLISKIIINPVAQDNTGDNNNGTGNGGDDTTVGEAYAIPENLTVNVEIYFLNTEETNKKGVATKEVLGDITQQIITMTTVNSSGTEKTTTYVGYVLTDIVTKLGITVPAIDGVTAIYSDGTSSECDIKSLANAYITIGNEEGDEFKSDSSAPRFIPDKNSNDAKSVGKGITKIVIIPIS